jgi:hypothetical protein
MAEVAVLPNFWILTDVISVSGSSPAALRQLSGSYLRSVDFNRAIVERPNRMPSR